MMHHSVMTDQTEQMPGIKSTHRPTFFWVENEIEITQALLELEQAPYLPDFHSSCSRRDMSRYAETFKNPSGAGDARPTAMQIVEDEGLVGNLQDKVNPILKCHLH